jgi:tetratricopeptide (TPR) repeat protein
MSMSDRSERRRWLEQQLIPPVPAKEVLSRYQVHFGGTPAEQERIRSINGLFGGSGDRFNGKEEAFEEACDVLELYLENGADPAEVTQEAVTSSISILNKMFPFCAEAYRTLAIVFQKEGLYDRAIECYAATDDEMVNETIYLEWGCIDHRPYLRTLHSNANCLESAGKLKKAKKMYQKLLRLNPNDNLGCRYSLYFLHLRAGELNEAEVLSKARKADRNANFLWGDVILKYLHLQLGHFTEDKLLTQLALALDENQFVPGILLSTDPKPPLPSTITLGERDEALSIVHNMKEAWDDSVPILSRSCTVMERSHLPAKSCLTFWDDDRYLCERRLVMNSFSR